MDLVLILKSFIGHHVPERLRPLCEQNGIPCLMVDRGYGPARSARRSAAACSSRREPRFTPRDFAPFRLH